LTYRAAGRLYISWLKTLGTHYEHEAGFLYRFIGPPPPLGSKKPEVTDTVWVHFAGQIVDNLTVNPYGYFQNSFKDDVPFLLNLQTIPSGLSLAYSLLTTNCQLECVLPSELAFGKNGVNWVIPPGAALVCRLQLVEEREEEVTIGTKLTANAIPSGYIQHPEGILYKWLVEPDPTDHEHPGEHDNITFHCEGKTMSGEIFETSFDRHSPYV
jgi:FKBP-type peptidyl-prolyl cis-trans isomerase